MWTKRNKYFYYQAYIYKLLLQERKYLKALVKHIIIEASFFNMIIQLNYIVKDLLIFKKKKTIF